MTRLPPSCLSIAASLIAALVGCSSLAASLPTVERFYFVARGIDGRARNDAYEAFAKMIRQTAIPGEYVTVVATPDHTPIAALCVPKGSKNVRLRKPSIRRQVRDLAAFFEAAPGEGSSQAEAPKIATTVRALRRTTLRLKIVVIADPVYVNEDEPTWSMVDGKVPRDGSVNASNSPWRATQKLPVDTSIAWMTPEAGFGDDLFHQEAITRWYRRYAEALGGSLDCVTPSASLAFNNTGSQFTEPLGEPEKGSGMKTVVSVSQTADPSEPTVAESPFGAAAIEMAEAEEPAAEPANVTPPVDVVDAPPSTLEALRGDLRHVVLIRDLSSSMARNSDLVVKDMTSKLLGLECDRLATIGFGARDGWGPAGLQHHPWFLWVPAWAEATPENRREACDAVAKWETGGGTPTLAALREARRLPDVTSVILWSDGLPSIGDGGDPQREVLDLAGQYARDGITINTIGVGNLSGRGGGELDLEGCQFLQQIATKTGGAYLAL